jgi:hypothetical protein
MTKIGGPGSESGSISERHRSADPDPHQNIMDPLLIDPQNTLNKVDYLIAPRRAFKKELQLKYS